MAPNLMAWLGWWLFPNWDPAQKELTEGKKKILKELPYGTLPNCSAPSLEMLKARLDKALSNLI